MKVVRLQQAGRRLQIIWPCTVRRQLYSVSAHLGRQTERFIPTPGMSAPRISTPKKRPSAEPGRYKKVKKQKAAKEGSPGEVLAWDVKELLDKHSTLDVPHPKTGSSPVPLPERFARIELIIEALSSTGDGLAYDPVTRRVYVVPFGVPGDTIEAKIVSDFPAERYVTTDFLQVIKPSDKRKDSLVRCPYFQTCSGCQFQMLDYTTQLEHKKQVIEKAYKNFSGIDAKHVPVVEDTHGSPRQYGYRTKLTPHFDGPSGSDPERISLVDGKRRWRVAPPIGFMRKGKPGTLDVEDCPIGTDAVRAGLRAERERVAKEIHTYKRGVTLLLRESTRRTPKQDGDNQNGHEETPAEAVLRDRVRIQEEHADEMVEKTCMTDPKATATEYISDFKFHMDAGSFFQNNNSVLPDFIAYVRSHAFPPPSSMDPRSTEKGIRYLVDAYCGAGLFTVTLSAAFKACTGIDISWSSIEAARRNVQENGITNATFQAADAPAIFESIVFPADETVVVIDPPRKGCDDSFLRQLLRYGPKRVVYVSCNVHTQARDVGTLVRGLPAPASEDGGPCPPLAEDETITYDIESLKPFDFFPQTSHVEGVAILARRRRRRPLERPGHESPPVECM